MSINDDEKLHLLGARLRDERKKLGHSQETAGQLVGRDRTTFRNWEAGKGSPTAADLGSLHVDGWDVLYIVTGKFSPIVAEEQGKSYSTPARRVAYEIAGMALSEEDAEALLAVARRFSSKK